MDGKGGGPYVHLNFAAQKVMFVDLFQLALKGVGVICATTLDQFAGVEESFIGLQVEEFEAPTWKKLLLVRALQARGGKKRPRVPQSSTNEPEPDAGLDEEAPGPTRQSKG